MVRSFPLCATRRTFFEPVRVGLHGPGWLYVLGMPPRGYLVNFSDFESPEHVLRTSARAHTFALGVRVGLSACPGARSRELEKRPEAGRENYADGQHKTHLYLNGTYISVQ